jgi:hypothetical protein
VSIGQSGGDDELLLIFPCVKGMASFYGRQGATWLAQQCKVTVISEDGVSPLL